MQSRSRALVTLGVIAAAVALFIVLKGDDDSSDTSDTASTGTTSTAAAKPLVIQVDKSGKPVGGVAQLSVNKGEVILFTVDSAVSDEVHLHGYDIAKEVEAGGSVTFTVPATIEGVFEAELEQHHEQILELTVNP